LWSRVRSRITRKDEHGGEFEEYFVAQEALANVIALRHPTIEAEQPEPWRVLEALDVCVATMNGTWTFEPGDP
jgi:hypothetical protein